MLLYNALLRVIERDKNKGITDFSNTMAKIDIFLAADKITADEYFNLLEAMK